MWVGLESAEGKRMDITFLKRGKKKSLKAQNENVSFVAASFPTAKSEGSVTG